MTSVVLHVMHCRLIVVKQSMFSVVERNPGFVGGPDIVLRVRMFRRLLMVPRSAKRMTMRSKGLMRRVGVVLADLIVSRRGAAKLRRVSVMHCRGGMVPRG